MQGQIGQIDVHGQPREILYKKIDCRAPLQGKGLFFVYQRQDSQKQFRLLEEDGIPYPTASW
jgi:hypothetical protein